MKKHNIGGSVFSSSSEQILKPITWSLGVLQVRPDIKNDTHELVWVAGESETVLAEHPNGFSCHELAKRIVAGRNDAQDQAEYIIRCGGKAAVHTVRHLASSTAIENEQEAS